MHGRHQPDSLALDAQMPRTVDAVGFVDWNVEAGKMVWDRGAEERLGVPSGSMSTFEEWASFVEPEDVARIREEVGQAIADQRDRIVYRYRFHRPDGETRLIEGVALCWYDGDRLVRTSGVILDITRSEAARDALARSEAQLRTIIETVPDAMVVIDEQGIIRSFNGSAERMFGYAAAEMVGANISRLMPDAIASEHDDAIRRYLETGERRVIGRTRTLVARRADGREFPMELNVGEVTLADGRFFTGFVRDISERADATAQFEKLRQDYLRQSRLNAMGVVAAELAHELNQPLAASANFLAASRLMLDAGRSADDVAPMLDQAGAQVALVGDMIRRLRDFLSPGEHPGKPTRLADLAEEALALAFVGRDRSAYRLTCRCIGDPRDPIADRVQILQVLVNLIRNAADALACAPGSAIEIEARPAGDKVEISVSDNGPGFDPDLLGRLGISIISTKGQTGMGLGLTICRRIVESWNGELGFADRPEGGARVSFTVPAAAG